MTGTLVSVASWSLQFGIVVLAVAAALTGARVRSPSMRLAAWHAALLTGIASPLVGAALFPAAPSLLGDQLAAVATAAASGATTSTTLDTWSAAVLATLAAGTLVRGAWVFAGLWRLRRWAAMPSQPSEIFDRAARELNVRARLVCADVASPFTFGFSTPIIVTNAQLLRQPRLARAAFLHELIHVARRDWCFVLAEEAVRSLFWFHPATWWATAELRIAREELVDRLAAVRLGSRRAYLDALLSASQARSHAWRAVPAMVHRRQLARRVRALAAEVHMSVRHAALAVLAILVTVCGAAYASASAFPLRAASTAAVTSADDDVEKPVPTRQVQAVYPPEAKEKGIQGEVELEVRIGADGLVKDAKVVKSIPELDDSALTAIRQWEFRPGRKNGKAVEVLTTITFAFRLK